MINSALKLNKTENALDAGRIRAEFPILKTTAHDKPLVYLDSAASAQKPARVIQAMSDFYSRDYANIHRGIYELSARATECYESAREKVRQFINAASKNEIVFVRGTTEGINLLAQTFGRTQLKAGDEIILTQMEHHSNIVPWRMLSEQIGIVIKVAPITQDGAIDISAYQRLFSSRTRMAALVHAANATGTLNPVKEMITFAHQHNVPVLLDGAQAIAHIPVDVQELDCDFYVFSGHKLYGPTGIGVLYAKNNWLSGLPPYQGGGGMIETVAFDKVTYADAPQRFEAGTPDIAGAIGLAAAIDYLDELTMSRVAAHDQRLLDYAEERLAEIPGLRIIGTAKPKVGVISFVIEDIHPHDIGTVLDHAGVAVRAGHHCAMPLMRFFNVPATVRASFGVYNDFSDIDALIEALLTTKRLFS